MKKPSVVNKVKSEPLISRSTVARLAGGVCNRTIKRWEAKGLLTPHRLSYCLVAYPESEVERLLSNGNGKIV